MRAPRGHHRRGRLRGRRAARSLPGARRGGGPGRRLRGLRVRSEGPAAACRRARSWATSSAVRSSPSAGGAARDDGWKEGAYRRPAAGRVVRHLSPGARPVTSHTARPAPVPRDGERPRGASPSWSWSRPGTRSDCPTGCPATTPCSLNRSPSASTASPAAGVAGDPEALVIGAGGVGLTAAAWARVHGAERVTAVDPDPRPARMPRSGPRRELRAPSASIDDHRARKLRRRDGVRRAPRAHRRRRGRGGPGTRTHRRAPAPATSPSRSSRSPRCSAS